MTSEHHVGHSPGIGYPSSCFIPNDLQQTTAHSYSGGFIGLGLGLGLGLGKELCDWFYDALVTESL